jgi:hypothetical protein
LRGVGELVVKVPEEDFTVFSGRGEGGLLMRVPSGIEDGSRMAPAKRDEVG